MSELIDTQHSRRNCRWYLMATASFAALASLSTGAFADDADRPTVWIELGGQLEGLNDCRSRLRPRFCRISRNTESGRLSVSKNRRNTALPPKRRFPSSQKIVIGFFLRPLSIALAKNKSSHQQTPNAHLPDHVTLPPSFGSRYINAGTLYPSSHVKFADAAAKQSESHAVLDFQAGKDVGLGLFGGHGTSVLSVGIRFAQFSSKSKVTMRMEPDVQSHCSNHRYFRHLGKKADCFLQRRFSLS